MFANNASILGQSIYIRLSTLKIFEEIFMRHVLQWRLTLLELNQGLYSRQRLDFLVSER
jgi:hypothetical protein